MKKTDWIEEHNKEIQQYDKSILSHNKDNDFIKNYEFSISHHEDESYCERDDWYEPMSHFKD